MDGAGLAIERWRVFCNTERPHSSLGYRPPAPETLSPIEELPPEQIGFTVINSSRNYR